MTDIILPKRGAPGPGRRPDESGPGNAREPGPGIPADVARERDRQQKLTNAVEAAKIRNGVATRLREDLDARAAATDFADDAARRDFDGVVDREIGSARQGFRTASGAARLSDPAAARLDRDLDSIGQTFRQRAAGLHLTALEQHGMDQLLAATGNAAERSRLGAATVPAADIPLFITTELDLFDETMDEFAGALRGNRERDIRADGKTKIIQAGLMGLAGAGRGSEALALLETENIGGLLDQASRDRLKRDAAELSHAHEWDRRRQESRAEAEAARAREAAAQSFTTGFRTRMDGGGGTLAEIAEAEIGGILTPPQADRLRTVLEDARRQRAETAARTGRVTKVLHQGKRLDPADPIDRADAALHYDEVLRPSLADMDPAAKAAAIGVYGDRTGYLPRRALDTLLALAVAGETGNRVGAVHHLLQLFDADPTARYRVPPMLATAADLVGALSITGQIPPNRITDLVDSLLRDALTGKATGPSSPGATPDKGTAIPLPHFLPDVMLDKDADLSNPGLILLASAQSGASGEADAPADDRQAQAAEGQAEPSESRKETEGDEENEGATTDRRGNQPDPNAKKDETPVGADLLGTLDNEFLAAQQGTSPVVRRLDGTLNYRRAPQSEQDLYDELNIVRDASKHVVLRDPDTNRPTVFLRSPETDEGGIARAARLLGLGLASDPIRFSKRGVSRAVQGGNLSDGRSAADDAAETVTPDADRPGIGHNRPPPDDAETKPRPTGLKLQRDAFAEFVTDLFTGRRKPQGELLDVGALNADVQAFVREKGIDPASNQITVEDRRLRRMRRDTKVKAAKAVPEEDIKRLPDIINKPKAILWDRREAAKGEPALLYVFDPSGGDRLGKIFVRVDFADPNRKMNTNSVRSAGLVPKRNLEDANIYQIVQGTLE